jgi:hypothetical protein
MSFKLLGFLVLSSCSGSVRGSGFAVRCSGSAPRRNRELRISNDEPNVNTHRERSTQKREQLGSRRSRVTLITIVVATLSACTATAPGAPETAAGIPRAADGKPDFSGVWAGPGFAHTGKDTDTATVRRYTDANMAPLKPGGKGLYRKYSGNVRIDDPTAVCLPNGLTRQIPLRMRSSGFRRQPSSSSSTSTCTSSA